MSTLLFSLRERNPTEPVTKYSLPPKIIFCPLDTPVQACSAAHFLVLLERPHPAEIVEILTRTTVNISSSQEIGDVIAGVGNILRPRLSSDGLADSVCVLLHGLVRVSDRGFCKSDLNLV